MPCSTRGNKTNLLHYGAEDDFVVVHDDDNDDAVGDKLVLSNGSNLAVWEFRRMLLRSIQAKPTRIEV